MDFSSLMDRLIKYNTNTSNSNYLSLDRTLGTVATVTITLGVYRMLSAVSASRSDSNRRLTMSEVFELIRLCLGSLFLGNSQAFTNGDGQNGWSSWRRNKNGVTSVAGTMGNCREMKRFDGSCHCQSVRFVLKAPTKIVARQDNRGGKICHPYYATTAEKFELLCGTKYLSVYYVNLTPPPSNDRQQGHSSNRDEVIIAAHTFCSRCGVHIFRAPNSRTDQLDVNVDCLEDRCSVVDVIVDKDKNGMGMGSGTPCKSATSSRPLNHNGSGFGGQENDDDDDVQEEDDISVSRVDCPHPELIQLILTKHPHKNGTPTTSATTSSTTLLHVADSEEDGFSYDDTSTLRSTQSTMTGRISYQNSAALYRTNSSSFSVSAADNISVSDWEIGSSSVISLPLRKNGRTMDDGISLPSMPLPKNVESRQSTVNNSLPPSAVLKDRLKHYMKKHHVSSKSSSFRQETIEENRSFR